MALHGLLDGDDQVRRAWKHVQTAWSADREDLVKRRPSAKGRRVQPGEARRRTLAVLVAALLAAAACSASQLSLSEQTWAEKLTLEVARINDLVSLRLLPALLGNPSELGGVVSAPTGSDPDWEGISAACSSLTTELDEVRLVAETAPDSFTEVGRQLDTYADELAAFSSACDSAVLSQDEPALRSASNHLSAAGDALAELSEMLPPGIGCPDEVPNRPQSCDVPGS